MGFFIRGLFAFSVYPILIITGSVIIIYNFGIISLVSILINFIVTLIVIKITELTKYNFRKKLPYTDKWNELI